MLPVLHLRKELTDPPVAVAVEGVSVRTFAAAEDSAAWLALRDRATADLLPRPRSWTNDDFASEMLGKPWWRNDWTWFVIDGKNMNTLVGTVTLALREGVTGSVPIIHWLLVDPTWRRRGVGRLLVLQLERAAWDEGFCEVQLETHAAWQEAVAFYHSIGYAPLRDRSPR